MDAAGGASGGGVVDPTALLQLLLSQMVPRPPPLLADLHDKSSLVMLSGTVVPVTQVQGGCRSRRCKVGDTSAPNW